MNKLLLAAAMAAFALPAFAQDSAKSGEQGGCTTGEVLDASGKCVPGVPGGEGGMPETQHQQDVLKGAAKGDTAVQGSTGMPETEHQKDTMKTGQGTTN